MIDIPGRIYTLPQTPRCVLEYSPHPPHVYYLYLTTEVTGGPIYDSSGLILYPRCMVSGGCCPM